VGACMIPSLCSHGIANVDGQTKRHPLHKSVFHDAARARGRARSRAPAHLDLLGGWPDVDGAAVGRVLELHVEERRQRREDLPAPHSIGAMRAGALDVIKGMSGWKGPNPNHR
jgi:hypothetical protein